MVNFKLTDEQKALQNKAKKFAEEEIIPIIHKYDEKEEFPMELAQKAFDVGLMNVRLPKKIWW